MKKNLISKAGKEKGLRILMMVLVVVLLIMIVSLPALAVEEESLTPEEAWERLENDVPGSTSLLQIVGWIADWTSIIGLVVAFFGGLQTAFGFMNDDADAKVSGLKVMAAGFMVYGISKSLDLFFPMLG